MCDQTQRVSVARRAWAGCQDNSLEACTLRIWFFLSVQHAISICNTGLPTVGYLHAGQAWLVNQKTGAFCCGSGHSCTTGPKGPDILLLGVSFSMSVRSLAHGTKASPCFSQFSHETLSQHLRAAEKTHKGSGSGAKLRVTIRLCDRGWYVQRRGRRFINWISELVRVFLLHFFTLTLTLQVNESMVRSMLWNQNLE